jgi:hypothetical protein
MNNPEEIELIDNNYEDNENNDNNYSKSSKFQKVIKVFNYLFSKRSFIKNLILLLIFLSFCLIFSLQNESKENMIYTISSGSPLEIQIPKKDQLSIIYLEIYSKWIKDNNVESKLVKKKPLKFIFSKFKKAKEEINIYYQYKENESWITIKNETIKFYDKNGNITNIKQTIFTFDIMDNINNENLRLFFDTNIQKSMPISINLINQNILFKYRIIFALLLFIFCYSLIIFDVVERPIAGK